MAVLAIGLMVTGCSAGSDSTVLTAQGYGAINFGAPLSEAEAKLQQPAAPPQSGNEGCSYVTFAQYPDIRFMVENGIVTRADAGESIANASGFAAGDSSVNLEKANPQIKVMPHKYEPESRYMILAAPDGKSALVFEETGGLITKVRGGVEPSVEYVEGCG